MSDYIKREDALGRIIAYGRAHEYDDNPCIVYACNNLERQMNAIPAADVVEIPATGIGDLSDGYHTFNGLYYQRMILFATLVKQNKDRSWKSYRHEDGEMCFGGGWFIVGIDTPEGSYTYHYEDKDWDRFECEELPVAKHWDGHTEKDVTRLLSIDVRSEWIGKMTAGGIMATCRNCGKEVRFADVSKFCPNCGAEMRGEEE